MKGFDMDNILYDDNRDLWDPWEIDPGPEDEED